MSPRGGKRRDVWVSPNLAQPRRVEIPLPQADPEPVLRPLENRFPPVFHFGHFHVHGPPEPVDQLVARDKKRATLYSVGVEIVYSVKQIPVRIDP